MSEIADCITLMRSRIQIRSK